MSVKVFIKCILSFKGIVSDSGERLLNWIVIADYTFKFHVVFMYIHLVTDELKSIALVHLY